MREQEQQSDEHWPAAAPLHPTPLPPDLADFFRAQRFACLTHATDRGTAFVLKIPHEQIERVRGPVPIGFHTELYLHPASPILRLVLTIYDQPESHLALETFVNVADPEQRADFAALEGQRALTLLFYDERLEHRLTKQLRFLGGVSAALMIRRADALLEQIPSERVDFDRAKARVLGATGF